MRDFKPSKLVANQKSPTSVMQPLGGHDMYKEARVIDPHESETARERYDELMGGMKNFTAG